MKKVFWFTWERAHWLLPLAASVSVLTRVAGVIGPLFYFAGDNGWHILAEHSLANAVEANDSVFGPMPLDMGAPLLRFYQPLFYLTTLASHMVTGWDIRTLHMLVMSVCFILSPLTYCWGLRKIGLPRFAAGFAGLGVPLSVAGFGNSIESLFALGVSTQAMGALFFPLFIGGFAGMLKGRNRVVAVAVLFVLACLSHAMMTVYSVIFGTLYFLVTNHPIRANWKRLTGFCVLGMLLASFWLIPFLEHTMEHRSVPDSVLRGSSRRWWFQGLTDEQLVKATVTGRIFDDPRAPKGEQTDPLDKLVDKINILRTKRVRPPVLTILIGVGLLFGLLGFRRGPPRFMVAGFAFSFLLLAGPDDHPWLMNIPFMGNIQTFRCTYALEFFGFGLAGLGVESILKGVWRLSKLGPMPLSVLAGTVVAATAGFAIFLAAWEVDSLGDAYVGSNESRRGKILASQDAVSSLPNKGYPFRMDFGDRSNIDKIWLGSMGYRFLGTHWHGVGPTAAFSTVTFYKSRLHDIQLRQLMGSRYLLGQGKTVRSALSKEKAEDGRPLYIRVPNGKDRKGKANKRFHILDARFETFLVPMLGKPLPVVCRSEQWQWIVEGWARIWQGRYFSSNTPVPFRVKAPLAETSLIEEAELLLYLDSGSYERDAAALREFTKRGGEVIALFEEEGFDARVLTKREQLLKLVERKLAEKRGARRELETVAETSNPAWEIVSVDTLEPPVRTSQRYVYDVEALEKVAVILPMEFVAGWSATIDGREIEIFPAGLDEIGAVIPAGAHRLDFRWSMPAMHMAMLLACLVTLALIAAFWVLSVAGTLYLRRSLRRTCSSRRCRDAG